MSPSDDLERTVETDDRLDLHNTSVDTQVATAHLCGTVDLRTGCTCIRPVHHEGSCRFVPKDAAREATETST